jgi:hypothetical protein
MTYNLRIDSLVLDGLDLSRSEAPLVRAAVEAELSRLFTERDHSEGFRSSESLASLPAGPITRRSGEAPASLGRKIARAVYGGIGT